MKLSSPEFEDGGDIPEKYGYTKQNVNPSLRIEDVPDEAESLVLIVDDPDAVEPAGKIWDHWIMFNIDPDIDDIGEGETPGTEGKNDYGEIGYGGPNPPNRPHTYVFRIYALDQELRLGEGDSRPEVETAMRDHVIDKDTLDGVYSPV
jgi:Raf kinase inhibitor-like YbhB/YbcL family protein